MNANTLILALTLIVSVCVLNDDVELPFYYLLLLLFDIYLVLSEVVNAGLKVIKLRLDLLLFLLKSILCDLNFG